MFRHLKLYLSSFFLLISSSTFSQYKIRQVSIGGELPKEAFEFVDTSGNFVGLLDLKKENGTLFLFSSNNCSFVRKWKDRYEKIARLARDLHVGFAVINSNSRQRDKGESLADMKKYVEKNGFGSSFYLLDVKSRFANAIGAQTTPQAFLFDKNNRLVYKGTIDDHHRSQAKVKSAYLINALTNLSTGKPISPAVTSPKGCSIKRVGE